MSPRWFSFLLVAAHLCAQITPEASLSYTDVSGVHLSPDGLTALFVISATDLTANRTNQRVMKATAKGVEEVSGIVPGAGSIHWAPDSKRVAYIAGKAIWVQDLASGKRVQVCKYDHPNSFLSKEGEVLAWSPDGTRLAFAGTVDPAPARGDPVVVDRIQYKTRTSLSDNRRTHIYVVAATGGTPRAVTSGRFDEHSIDWGGNGKEIIFLSNRESNPDARLSYDIFGVDVDSGKLRQITHTPGVEYNPVMSPNGRWIACVATSRPITTIDSVAEDNHVHLIPAAGGNGRDLTAALDRRSTAPHWSSDGATIYFLASDHGKVLIFQIPAGGGSATPLFDKPVQVTSYSAAQGRLFYTASDPLHPPELFSTLGQVTHFNSIQRAHFSSPERISFESFDGTPIEGWLYPPLRPSRHVPMILTIHGGPHGMFGYTFAPAVQLNASSGYATLTINPRGSTGYGQRFSDGTLNDWGGGDYQDLMSGVDYVLAHHPEIDPQRLGVTGPSYGGYMTNWIITQTQRFKAAVAVSSLSDLISFYATSLYQDLIHAEFNGFPWEGNRFALLWKESPLAHVSRVTTPTLFLHGEMDNEVHITQAEEMYTGLATRGIPTELVRYPREGHGFREPKHIFDSRTRTLNWMDRFLQERSESTNSK
jgi:dipeptidyl aminopeptidase/acylaminoacyl peptidase